MFCLFVCSFTCLMLFIFPLDHSYRLMKMSYCQHNIHFNIHLFPVSIKGNHIRQLLFPCVINSLKRKDDEYCSSLTQYIDVQNLIQTCAVALAFHNSEFILYAWLIYNNIETIKYLNTNMQPFIKWIDLNQRQKSEFE